MFSHSSTANPGRQIHINPLWLCYPKCGENPAVTASPEGWLEMQTRPSWSSPGKSKSLYDSQVLSTLRNLCDFLCVIPRAHRGPQAPCGNSGWDRVECICHLCTCIMGWQQISCYRWKCLHPALFQWREGQEGILLRYLKDGLDIK